MRLRRFWSGSASRFLGTPLRRPTSRFQPEAWPSARTPPAHRRHHAGNGSEYGKSLAGASDAIPPC